jgi:RNA polymerase sigma-70 factor (ECF subfamily)
MSEEASARLQTSLDLLRHGDPAALDGLIRHTVDRLNRLTRKMLQGFPRLQRWLDSDDLLQNALLRLLQALRRHTPTSAQHFFRLAALELRRELVDLTRHYFGPEGSGANHASASGPVPDKPESTYDPQRLACWTEFHRQVEALPAEERDVFELLHYQGLSQTDAAALLGLSLSTVKRRWTSAVQRLPECPV